MSEQRTFRARYPSHPARVKVARREAEHAAQSWRLCSAASSSLVLVASELVANAVIHAKTPRGRQVGLTMRLLETVVRVEVRDADSTPPTPPSDRDVEAISEGGRGLLLVESISLKWGVQLEVFGKTVWAEIAREDISCCPYRIRTVPEVREDHECT